LGFVFDIENAESAAIANREKLGRDGGPLGALVEFGVTVGGKKLTGKLNEMVDCGTAL
jgi:hypothetical protein